MLCEMTNQSPTVAVILSACAAVIASQALITGSYSLVSEATHLNLFPHLNTKYPSETKGQLYIPAINMALWIGCCFVVLYFKSGSAIESAYGLAITVTMLMTTLLLSTYLAFVKKKVYLAIPVLVIFGAIEFVFFISSLSKFSEGGYITAIIALLIFAIMLIWNRGTRLEKRFKVGLNIKHYIDAIDALRNDESIPYTADNIVYLENENDLQSVDRDILYSILDKNPKRAKAYWFINVATSDDPNTMEYSVETFGTDFMYFVSFTLGYKVENSINAYFRQVVADLSASGELPSQDRQHSIYGPSNIGTFKFVFLRKVIQKNISLSNVDASVLRLKYAIRKLFGSRETWYGFDTSTQIIETVPLFIANKKVKKLTRKK